MAIKSALHRVMSLRHRRIAREGMWVSTSWFFGAITLLLGTRAITQLVPPSVFGTVSLLLGVMALARAALCTPIMQAAMRLYPEMAADEHVARLYATIQPVMLSVSLLIGIALTVFGVFFAQMAEVKVLAFVLLGVLTILDISRIVETDLMSAARRQKPVAILKMMDAALRPLLIIVAVLLWGANASAMLAGQVVASAAVLAATWRLIRREGISASKFNCDLFRNEIVRYALPLAPLAVVVWVTGLSDRYIIGSFLGLSEVGIYAATYGLIFYAMTILPGVIEATLRPAYFEAVASGNIVSENKIFRTWVIANAVLSAVSLGGVVMFHNLFATLLLAPHYRSGAALMPWIALGFGFYALCNVYEKPCYAYKMTGLVLFEQAVGAAVCLIVEITFIWRWGLMGAALAVPCYFGVQLIVTYAMAGRAKKLHYAAITHDLSRSEAEVESGVRL